MSHANIIAHMKFLYLHLRGLPDHERISMISQLRENLYNRIRSLIPSGAMNSLRQSIVMNCLKWLNFNAYSKHNAEFVARNFSQILNYSAVERGARILFENGGDRIKTETATIKTYIQNEEHVNQLVEFLISSCQTVGQALDGKPVRVNSNDICIMLASALEGILSKCKQSINQKFETSYIVFAEDRSIGGVRYEFENTLFISAWGGGQANQVDLKIKKTFFMFPSENLFCGALQNIK